MSLLKSPKTCLYCVNVMTSPPLNRLNLNFQNHFHKTNSFLIISGYVQEFIIKRIKRIFFIDNCKSNQ